MAPYRNVTHSRAREVLEELRVADRLLAGVRTVAARCLADREIAENDGGIMIEQLDDCGYGGTVATVLEAEAMLCRALRMLELDPRAWARELSRRGVNPGLPVLVLDDPTVESLSLEHVGAVHDAVRTLFADLREADAVLVSEIAPLADWATG